MDVNAIVSKAYARAGVPLDTAIHPNDEVYAYIHDLRGKDRVRAILEYCQTGHHNFSVVDQVLRWAGRPWESLSAMLDFASGYGRMTRFLCQAMAPAKIWVSEILPPAVPFQQQTFGVGGVPSVADPAALKFPRAFDLITVISLFTHLPMRTFEPWLRKLAESLAPGGMLVIATHGPELFESTFGRKLTGSFFFEPLSEIPSLDPESYGRTYCEPAFVREIVGRIPGVEVLGHATRSLNGEHDVFVIGRGCRRPEQPLRLHGNPLGHVDILESYSDGARTGAQIVGWALDGADRGPVARITLAADGEVVGQALPDRPRPDLAQAYGVPRAADGGWVFRGANFEHVPEWLSVVYEDRHGQRTVQVWRVAGLRRESRR